MRPRQQLWVLFCWLFRLFSKIALFLCFLITIRLLLLLCFHPLQRHHQKSRQSQRAISKSAKQKEHEENRCTALSYIVHAKKEMYLLVDCVCHVWLVPAMVVHTSYNECFFFLRALKKALLCPVTPPSCKDNKILSNAQTCLSSDDAAMKILLLTGFQVSLLKHKIDCQKIHCALYCP